MSGDQGIIGPTANGTPQQSGGLFYALRLMPSSVWLPLAAISVLGAAAFFVNEWSVGRVRAQAESVSRLMKAQNLLIELRGSLVDAETGQRGYLLTRDPAYLAPYERALTALPTLGGEVRELLGKDPEFADRITALEGLRGRKIAEVGATIQLATQGDRTEALTVIRTGQGQKLMDAFRASADEIIRLVEEHIELTREAQIRNVMLSRFASAALGLLTLVLLFLVVRLFMGEAIRQDRLRYAEEFQRRKLEGIVEERTRELSELSTHLQNVREQEKADLARDLHDELGGLLTAAKMDLAWMQGRATGMDEELSAKLRDLSDGLTEAMNLKRRVVENLRPALLEHFGLPTALQAYFDETCRKAGINCRTTIPDEFENVPTDVAIALFRVGQESLTNIVRHAKAQNVDMVFEETDSDYVIRISDDGAGVDLGKLRASHGLAGMRHRIESLGGEFGIESAIGLGTNVRIRVPRR